MVNNLYLSLQKKLFLTAPIQFILNFFVWGFLGFLPMITGFMVMAYTESLTSFQSHSWYYIAALIGLSFLQVLFIFLGGKYETLTTFRVMISMKEKVLEKLFHKNKSRKSSAELLNITECDIAPFTTLISLEMDLVLKIFMYIGSLIILCRISLFITLCTFVPIILIQIFITFKRKKMGEMVNRKRKAEISFSNITSELIKNREAVKQFHCTEQVMDLFNLAQNEQKNSTVKVNTFNQKLTSLNSLVYGLSLVLILCFFKYSDNMITFSEVILFTSYMAFGFDFLNLYYEMVDLTVQMKAGVERIEQNMNIRVEELFCEDKKISQQRSGKELKIKYKNNIITLNEGQIFNLENVDVEDFLSVLQDAHSGLSHLENIGLVKKETCLLNKTIKENICLGVIDEDRYSKVIQCACLENVVSEAQEIGENGSKLSEGQRKRVSIARALYHGKDLIILDSPFANIDKENAEKILFQMKAMGLNRIILFINEKHVSLY